MLDTSNYENALGDTTVKITNKITGMQYLVDAQEIDTFITREMEWLLALLDAKELLKEKCDAK